MVKMMWNVMSACLLTGDAVLTGATQSSLDANLDEAGLVQTFRHPVQKRDELSVKANLAAAEKYALANYTFLQAALAPLAKIEVGKIETMNQLENKDEDQYERHTFLKAFSTVPVVTAVMSTKGTEPAEVRVFDVTKFGFKVAVVEAPGWKGKKKKGNKIDGLHKSERIDFIAIIPGTHEVHGRVVEAGLLSTNAVVTKKTRKTAQYEQLTWKNLTVQPATFASLNSINNDPGCYKRGKTGAPWMTVAQRDVDGKGARIAIDRSEVNDKLELTEEETIGWIAVAPATVPGFAKIVRKKKLCAGFPCRLGIDDALQKKKKAAIKRTMKDSITVVSKSSRRGQDGGWTRILKRTKDKVYVVVDEDMSQGSERHHIHEDVSMAEFKSAFTDCLGPDCCTDRDDCKDKHEIARQAALDYAAAERQVMAAKRQIVDFYKKQDERLQREAKNLQNREKNQKLQAQGREKKAKYYAERKANEIARRNMLNFQNDCKQAFHADRKVRLSVLPSDVQAKALETIQLPSDTRAGWTECSKKCCAPAEDSDSNGCSSIIFDLTNMVCYTMGDDYNVPTLGEKKLPRGDAIFAAAKSENVND